MPLPPDPSTGLPARHTCHCGKSFARKEHLTRHQATHEQLAYMCNVCQRRFSRREVLRRHSVLHDPNHTRVVVSCDACRANKTKCSGGNPCSLCTRRGINCTFRTSNHRLKRAPLGDGSTAVNAAVREGDDINDGDCEEPTLPTNSKGLDDISLNETSVCAEQEAPSHEWLQNLSIVPSRPLPMSKLQPFNYGIEAICELLLAERDSLEGSIEESDGLQEWLTESLDTYFKTFHLRWPVLNAPSFDASSASLPLAASVCVIGTWLRNDSKQMERVCALQVHEILMQRFLYNLIEPESMLEGQPWPIELFQAVLLSLIFSLYRTDKSALSRAMLLRGAFITFLREMGVFNGRLLGDHLKRHFSGVYAPYTLSMREKFTRLIALTYQFDAYFALVHEKPPILHRQEIGADLTITFALWNAHGLDIFAKRLLDEPQGRSGFKISAMTNCSSSFTSSQLLVEDVLLGLCGILQAIWVSKQSLPSTTKGYNGNSFQTVPLIEALHDWKHELDKINAFADTQKITSDDAKYLLLAYRGKSDTVASTLARIIILVQDGMALYYYLMIYHYTGLGPSELIELCKPTEGSCTEILRATKCGREAFACVMQLLEMLNSTDSSRTSINPLIWHALTLGIDLIKKLLVSSKNCECCVNKEQHAPKMDFQQWIEIGGPLHVQGISVCLCKSGIWIRKMEKLIQDQKIVMETS